jgi:hypothetical protein
LLSITRYGAEWLKIDKFVGSLEVGKFADLVIHQNDYFKQPEEMIGQNHPLLTVVGGKGVYAAKGWQHAFEVSSSKSNNGKHKRDVCPEAISLLMQPGIQELHDQLDQYTAPAMGRGLPVSQGKPSCGCGGH